MILQKFLAGAFLLFSTQSLAASPRTFTFRLLAEPETLDWNRAHTPVETYLLMNLMEGLTTFDSKMKAAPALAQSWKVSPDGKIYTFQLRPGVKWSDGRPLKAADFAYSWERLLSATTAADYAYFLFDIEGAEEFNRGSLKDFSKVGIKAINDTTFQVRLKHPLAHWIDIPTFWVTFPMRQDVVEKYGNSWTEPGHMVTVGPFNLAVHELDSKIILKPNPNYYGKRGNVEQVVGQVVKDESTALSLYETGKLDFVTDLSALDLKRLENRSDLKSFPYLKTAYLGFTASKPALANIKLRRALAMAIDISKLPEILHGRQNPAHSFTPPGMLGYAKDVGLGYNPAKAKVELKAAGITGPITVEILCPNWDKNLTIAQFVQEELKKNLGVELAIQAFDHKTYRAQLDQRAFPVFEASWSADYPDPDNFLSVFLGDAGNNHTGWKNTKFDELVMKARVLKDTKARLKLYKQAEKILIEEDAVILPLYYEPNLALVRNDVSGVELNPLNYLLLKNVNLAR